ncbi:MAG: hypothetical protein K6G29_07800, partial [Clostridiales bacterium]|nr:hypothetical protein [Clostridiales bacterium]
MRVSRRICKGDLHVREIRIPGKLADYGGKQLGEIAAPGPAPFGEDRPGELRRAVDEEEDLRRERGEIRGAAVLQIEQLEEDAVHRVGVIDRLRPHVGEEIRDAPPEKDDDHPRIEDRRPLAERRAERTELRAQMICTVIGPVRGRGAEAVEVLAVPAQQQKESVPETVQIGGLRHTRQDFMLL